jgi:predicted RNA-binding protein with TRAM domain
MKWLFNGTLFTDSVVTNYLKEKSFVAFVSILSKGDEVKIEVSPI